MYWVAVAIGAAICAVVCVLARRRPSTRSWLGRGIAVVLAADGIWFVVHAGTADGWSDRSLPLDLCDVALFVAAVTCWHPRPLGVELTWFWGMAGTLQAVITPDLSASFPSTEFWLFVVGHLGIVIAALYLIVGCGLAPRPGAVRRVFGITLCYTAFVGIVDALTGANYMFLRHLPSHASLLSVLGSWPWYILSAAGVAVVLFVLLDAPFRSRTCSRGRARSPDASDCSDPARSSRAAV